jgi:hypothetical protein
MVGYSGKFSGQYPRENALFNKILKPILVAFSLSDTCQGK